MKQLMEGNERDQQNRIILGKPDACQHCGAKAELYDDVYKDALESAKAIDELADFEELREHALNIADEVQKDFIKMGAVHLGLDKKVTWYHAPLRCCEKTRKENAQRLAGETKPYRKLLYSD